MIQLYSPLRIQKQCSRSHKPHPNVLRQSRSTYMSTLYILTGLILNILLSPCANAYLISNGDFEANMNDWRHFAVGGDVAEYSIVHDAYSGVNALSMNVTSRSGGDYALDRDSHRIKVNPNDQIIVSFAAKKISSEQRKLVVTISEYNTEGTYAGFDINYVFTPGETYDEFSLNYTVREASSRAINIAFRILDQSGAKTTGHYYLDDITVRYDKEKSVTLPTIYKWDLRPTLSLSHEQLYDTWHVAVGLQGLVNRDAPRVFLIFDAEDELWFNRLLLPSGLCEGWSVETINNLNDYVNHFSSYCSGIVLYDKSPETGAISTSLVATSVAAAEGGLAIRNAPASPIYQLLLNDENGPDYNILIDLSEKFTGSGTIWNTSIPSTGSAKCDAYRWYIEHYIETGKVDTTKIMSALDLWGLKPQVDINKAQLRNLDYAFSHKAVCLELSPWGDEVPNDDPGQPLGTDLTTYKKILDACNRQNNFNTMIKYCGFTNWDQKYTDHVGGKHGGVETEWEVIRIITSHNCYMEADAPALNYVSNTSFYNSLTPAIQSRRYTQNAPPSYQDMVDLGYIDAQGDVIAKNYIMMLMGDYDQVTWMLYWLAGDRFDDPQRGSVPCNWALTPNSIDRVGVAFDYMYRNKSENDFFLTGDSGAGYIHPSQLYGDRSPSGYDDGTALWRKHCEKYYRMLDISISGWLLNAGSGPMTISDADIYVPFSGDGIGYNEGLNTPVLRDNIPVISRITQDIYNHNISPDILGLTNNSGVHFNWFRSILLYPSAMKKLQDDCLALGNDYTFLDTYSFYYLLRYYLGGNNNYRLAWLNDNLPPIAQSGSNYDATITVRNDGWDQWTKQDNYNLAYAIIPSGQEPSDADFESHSLIAIDEDATISTGQSIDFTYSMNMPTSAGNYDIYLDMIKTNSATATELLTNGGFEDNFTDWRYFAVSGASATYQISSDAYQGSKAAQMTVTSGTSGDHAIDRDNHRLPIQPNKSYQIQFASKKIGSQDTRILLTVSEFNQAGQYLGTFGDKLFNPGNSTYTMCDFEYTIQSEQARFINIGFRIADSHGSKTAGSYLIDAVSVTESSLGDKWFHKEGNLPWKHSITITDDPQSIDTDKDGIPDVIESEKGLLPWHPDDGACGDLGYLQSDISGRDGVPDCIVDMYDLIQLARNWIIEGGPPTDLSGPSLTPDLQTNFHDYVILMNEWLQCNDPQTIDCYH